MTPEPAQAPVFAGVRIVKAHAARGGLARRGRARIEAVRRVSLAVARGEIYGLVGESGAGKSTLGRILALLESPDSGEVLYEGSRVDDVGGKRLRSLRRTVQIVFQDPGTALNPLQQIADIIQEPLEIHRLHRGTARPARVAELLAMVGLPGDAGFRERRPAELSGGERQRVAIARALACEPKALILDEPVSALDISVRGQVLNVLLDLRDRLGLAMLLIAHDLAVVGDVCDRVGVMLGGRIVEEGSTGAVLGSPLHPYTRTLVGASPAYAGASPAGAENSDGSAIATSGCHFLLRCDRPDDACREQPDLQPSERSEHWVACHFPEDL